MAQKNELLREFFLRTKVLVNQPYRNNGQGTKISERPSNSKRWQHKEEGIRDREILKQELEKIEANRSTRTNPKKSKDCWLFTVWLPASAISEDPSLNCNAKNHDPKLYPYTFRYEQPKNEKFSKAEC